MRALNARAANDRIAEKAERLQFRSRVPMLCECSTPDCRTILMVSLSEYREIRKEAEAFLIAPNHNLEEAELVQETATYSVQRLQRLPREGNGDRRSA